MVLIHVQPQPDPTKLHHEILKRMNNDPYHCRFEGVPDDFIPTKEQTEAIGAAIAEDVMALLYPASVDHVGTYDLIGTHLQVQQNRPRVNAKDYEQFCFYYKLTWEHDQEGFVTATACRKEEANVTVFCRILRLGEIHEYSGPLRINWEEIGETTDVDSIQVPS